MTTSVYANFIPGGFRSCNLDFLFRYHVGGKDFLDCIVTGDEKWVHHYTPEMKNVLKQWVAEGEDPPLKVKCERSAGKVNLTSFWDNKGILLQEYTDRTTNQQTYFDTMMNLRIVIKEKRRGKLLKEVVPIHNNEIPHKAHLILNLITDFGWDIFGHPPHSLNFAPSDYYLSAHLRHWLGEQRFADDATVKAGVRGYFGSLEEQHFASGIAKLIPRYEKCLAKMGNYVEKWSQNKLSNKCIPMFIRLFFDFILFDQPSYYDV